MTMMHKFILFMTIMFIKQSSVASDYIYQTVNGSLDNKVFFNFTLFVENFNGIILHSFDFIKNNFTLIIHPIEGEKHIFMKFNHKTNNVSLFILCGCDLCDNTTLHFEIQLLRTAINITCNKKDPVNRQMNIPESLKSVQIKNSILNKTSDLSIIIGNIQTKNKMTGCLAYFNYNSKNISFNNNGTKMNNVCPLPCKHIEYIAGACSDFSSNAFKCNCLITGKSNEYCDKNSKINKILEKWNLEIEVFQPLNINSSFLHNMDCRIENVQSNVISIVNKNKELIMNLSISEEDNVNVTKFINYKVDKTLYDLLVKVINNETIFFLLKPSLRTIDSKENEDLKKFQEQYDFPFYQRNQIMSTSNLMENTSTLLDKLLSKDRLKYVLGTIAGIFSLCPIITLICLIKRRKNQKCNKKKVIISNVPQSSELMYFTPESRTYGLVSDRSEYDYIDETDLYAIVPS